MMNDQNRKMEELKNQKSNRPSKKSLLLRLSSARNSRVIKVLSMMLAVMIVFGTTYSLILPAITVDQDSAEEMPGIYLEEESALDTDYEDGVQDADTVYEDGSQYTDYEEVYEDSDWDAVNADANEDSEWPVEEEAAYEEYSDYDVANEDEAYIEAEEKRSKAFQKRACQKEREPLS